MILALPWNKRREDTTSGPFPVPEQALSPPWLSGASESSVSTHISGTIKLARPHLRIKGDSSGLLVAPAAIFVCAKVARAISLCSYELDCKSALCSMPDQLIE